ncbi:serine hydrolase domain-containing protein [Arthrobacter sp. W4I7]|uniref:serine hydrolase domain-containing protein n=1 Tax=Arthrobacter sp. W4I7 TaxID=3042296 RepID=UPI00278163F3|nr:serine hydrolase domain-containing protein [Arthrobacter sp. W4I7]MDQ0691271.1 CubicO group peptidase (beta-lactamase class C family) [Arthrobacter sp. W4I7]
MPDSPVWKDGLQVIELSGGVADYRTGREFAPDTLSVVFSCTKGLASILVGMLTERGQIPSLETPVAQLWPEFAVHGKEQVSIGDALGHRAGLSATREDVPPHVAWNSLALADILAAQKPLWSPGANHQYHTVSHGALTAKMVLLGAGRSIGKTFAELIARPLHADAWIGLPESEEARVSHLVEDPQEEPDTSTLSDQQRHDRYWIERAANLNGPIGPNVYNRPEVHKLELPGAGGISTVRGLAKIWSATVTETDGVRLISDETVSHLSAPRSGGPSYFFGDPPYQAWGAGVMIPSDWERYLSPKSFGHDGAGGQIAFADPTAKIGFAYVTNRMGDFERGQSVIRALARTLA